MEALTLQITNDNSLTAGDLMSWRLDVARTFQYVRATLSTPQTSGNKVTIDIKHENGSSIFSTPIKIDNGQDASCFAIIQPVISSGSFTINEKMTISALIGDGTAKGLKLTFYDYVPDFGMPPIPPTETLIDRTIGTLIGDLTVFGLSMPLTELLTHLLINVRLNQVQVAM